MWLILQKSSFGKISRLVLAASVVAVFTCGIGNPALANITVRSSANTALDAAQKTLRTHKSATLPGQKYFRLNRDNHKFSQNSPANRLIARDNADALPGKTLREYLGKAPIVPLRFEGGSLTKYRSNTVAKKSSYDRRNTQVASLGNAQGPIRPNLSDYRSHYNRNHGSSNKGYVWPVDESIVNWISSGYGSRIHPVNKRRSFHNGIDIAAPIGTEVIAVADGKVIEAGCGGNIGKCVRISHPKGIESVYGHLSQFAVRVGQKVTQGEKIGEVGNTGRSTGPHLHFTMKRNAQSFDPYPLLERVIDGKNLAAKH
jgi:murein DD-endopeptidase MepM/ murein hydrolase activator NlpD